MPARSYDQRRLRELWNLFPHHRDRLLRIERVGVRARDLDTALRTAGDTDLRALAIGVDESGVESDRPPSVKVERS